jgi:hypothetical protein
MSVVVVDIRVSADCGIDIELISEIDGDISVLFDRLSVVVVPTRVSVVSGNVMEFDVVSVVPIVVRVDGDADDVENRSCFVVSDRSAKLEDVIDLFERVAWVDRPTNVSVVDERGSVRIFDDGVTIVEMIGFVRVLFVRVADADRDTRVSVVDERGRIMVPEFVIDEIVGRTNVLLEMIDDVVSPIRMSIFVGVITDDMVGNVSDLFWVCIVLSIMVVDADDDIVLKLMILVLSDMSTIFVEFVSSCLFDMIDDDDLVRRGSGVYVDDVGRLIVPEFVMVEIIGSTRVLL